MLTHKVYANAPCTGVLTVQAGFTNSHLVRKRDINIVTCLGTAFKTFFTTAAAVHWHK
jgi:hypothetical protein